MLADWLTGSGAGRSAVVVGCGLGADAEFVAAHGFATTAFDISATAVRTAQQRYPTSPVDYRTADLFALPGTGEAFDLVVEIINVQALPVSLRAEAVAAVAGLVAPGGTVLVVENVRTGPLRRRGPRGPSPGRRSCRSPITGSTRWRSSSSTTASHAGAPSSRPLRIRT